MKSYFSKHKVSWIVLAICLGTILLSSLFGGMVQSAGYQIDVYDLRDVSAKEELELTNDQLLTINLEAAGGSKSIRVNGTVSSGLLYVPKNASATNKLPAVVVTHGYLNSREHQLPFAVELARRGFVVLAIDREGHGNSTELPGSFSSATWGAYAGYPSALMGGGVPLYQAAAYLYYHDYVDQSAIAVTGHSMGGHATNQALGIDKTARAAGGTGILAGGMVQGYGPSNSSYHAEHSIGLLKAMDDEFFFASKFADGTASLCREYLQSTAGASFLGVAVTGTSKDSINLTNTAVYVAGVQTEAEFGAKVNSPFRVIYQADEVHPQNHFSTESTGYMVDFMYKLLGVPAGHEVIAQTRQVWQVKELFATIGLIAWFALIFPAADLLLDTPVFRSLKKKEDSETGELLTPALKGVQKHVSYWLAAVATTLFSGFMIEPIMSGSAGNIDWTKLQQLFFTQNTYYAQDTTGKVATWAIASGLFALFAVVVINIINRIINQVRYKENAGQYNENPFAAAKIDSLGSFIKTILLTVTIVGGMYLILFANWGIFKVDFRLWTFNAKVFNVAQMLPTMLRYSVPFFIFYGINSMFNQGYRVTIAEKLGKWNEVITIAINALFNVLGIVIVIAIQYATFRSTGVLWQPGMNLNYIVLFPIIPILIIATVISRRLYVKTGNCWLGAMVNTLLFTMITVAGTASTYGMAGLFA